MFFAIPRKYLPLYVLVLAYFGYATVQYARLPSGEYSTVFWVIHGVMHEVGHAVMRWAGQTLCILGGSIVQWLTPIACGIYFCVSEERHAALVALGWLGFSFLDSAAYMRDAIEQELPLVAPFASDANGEVLHDWNTLFTQWGVLPKAHAIGNVFAGIGYFCVAAAMIGIILAAIYGFLRNGETQAPAFRRKDE